MNSSLQEVFARLGPTRAERHVPSGSPGTFVLSIHKPLRGDGFPRTIEAIRSLVRRGLEVPAAKRAIETLFDQPHLVVELPLVESAETLIADLAASGVVARQAVTPDTTDQRRVPAWTAAD